MSDSLPAEGFRPRTASRRPKPAVRVRRSRGVTLNRAAIDWHQWERFPPTRFQGSKRKLARAIVTELLKHSFDTVLDAFGGTASIAYALKCAGKEVAYNDCLRFNAQIGAALIANDDVRLGVENVQDIMRRHEARHYGDFVERTFGGIYFTDSENRWLDVAVANIGHLRGRYRRAVAWFALIQSAIAKRPYNLFHRNNLYMRAAKVGRSFGNKTSWDRSFREHFLTFAAQANGAVFRGLRRCRAMCGDVLDVEPEFELVYIDPPYMNRTGIGVDYRDFYHFLEGLVQYKDWAPMVDYASKHRRLHRLDDPWSDPKRIRVAFRDLFAHFRGSILAVSYRSDGQPSITELADILSEFKPRVRIETLDRYQYALSTRRTTQEVLLVGTGSYSRSTA